MQLDADPDPEDSSELSIVGCMPTVLLPVMRVAVTPLLTRPAPCWLRLRPLLVRSAPCWLRLRPLRLRKDGRVDPGAGRICTSKKKQLLKDSDSLVEYNTCEGIS
jgi:hypothetical protein